MTPTTHYPVWHYINIQRSGDLMINNDNITELYYRVGFGECVSCSSVDRAFLEQRSVVGLNPIGAAFTETYSSMRIGSVEMLRFSTFFFISSFTHSSLGTIEPQAKDNYPTNTITSLLPSQGAWVLSCVVGLLEMVAVKTILLLEKTIKRTKILSNGLPFHLRPMVT